MKNKVSEMIKDKLFLVMLVLGLLTIVAAAGVMTLRRSGGEPPYMEMEDGDSLLAENGPRNAADEIAGESNAQPAGQETKTANAASNRENPDTVIREDTYEPTEQELADTAGKPAQEDALAAGSGLNAATAFVLDFADTSRLNWPVRGNVLLDYSMDTTIYFPTLDQYKCNPAIVIQGEVSEPVSAPANARVLEKGSNEEIGNYLSLDFGNGYTAICGQLKEVSVSEGEYLEKGQIMGYVAEPTKYYTVEGSNLYFEMRHEGETIDPLDYME